MLTAAFALAAAQVPTQAQGLPPCVPVTSRICDEYTVTTPASLTDPSYPLIVMFHGFGETARQETWLLGASAFIDEATTWSQSGGLSDYIVVLHDGGSSSYYNSNQAVTVWSHATYGNEAFMDATKAVIDEVVATYPVDTNRIYGYGLSMGGGECLSFAARHQDPTSNTMLAAVFNQSGAISTTRWHSETTLTVQEHISDILGISTYPDYLLYGASSEVDFLYQRATVIDLPFDYPVAGPLDYMQEFGFHLAHNLRWLPSKSHYFTNDSIPHVVEPNDALEDFFNDDAVLSPAAEFPLMLDSGADLWEEVAPATVLSYFDQKDRASSLDLFSTHIASPVVSELILFSEDNTRHHSFSVTRTNPGQFGRLHVRLLSMDSTFVNGISFTHGADNAIDNISSLKIHVDGHLTHLDWATPPVLIDADDVDLGTIEVDIEGVSSEPALVRYLLDDPPGGYTDAMPGDWAHSGTTLSLFVNQNDGLQRKWLIVP